MLDEYYLNTTKSYLENGLIARLAYNKPLVYLDRYLTSFFAAIDPNYFFFGGHPRETPGFENGIRISYWLLPFFILGLYEMLRDREYRLLGIYLILAGLLSLVAIDKIWLMLIPFWYLTALYPFKALWKKSS